MELVKSETGFALVKLKHLWSHCTSDVILLNLLSTVFYNLSVLSVNSGHTFELLFYLCNNTVVIVVTTMYFVVTEM